MIRGPIALLTDFGTGDPYVAAMKGVILTAAPRARIVDVTHEVPRHDVDTAAHVLRSAAPFFPPGTVFVCVVDPGVGTRRRILLLRKEGRYLLAPDNGLLDRYCEGTADERWYALRRTRPGRGISPTFHGRDVFAPAAARLASGSRTAAIAVPASPPAPVALYLDLPPAGSATGRVVQIDRFGNIITNVRIPRHPPAGLRVELAGRRIRRFSPTYDGGPDRGPFLVRGSTGLLEVALKREDAARLLRVRRGDAVRVRR